jgi:heptosyltransferase-2/heptosyltransferase-3
MIPPCERPLAVRCGAFGDMVLLTALIRVLHARFRSPVDILTTGSWSEPLLHGQPGVGDIFTMRSRKTPYWMSPGQRRVVRQLRARGVGPTWLCDSDEGIQPILDRAGITAPHIVAARDHPLLHGEHATAQWRRMAQITPAVGPLPRPVDLDLILPGCSLEVSAAQAAQLEAWLQARGMADSPLILVQAGNKRTMRRGPRRLAVNHKYWPNEHWAEVLQFLRHHHPGHRIVLLGTGPEFALNQQIAALANIDRLHNAADDLPIPRLVALLNRADGLLNVDSGPAHAGAAVGCPQVVLFGRALPSLYRPWGVAGADVQLLTGEIEGQPSMLGISPREVIAAWGRLKLRGQSNG